MIPSIPELSDPAVVFGDISALPQWHELPQAYRDGWHRDYRGAPVDGSAWMASDPSNPYHERLRVIRGGSSHRMGIVSDYHATSRTKVGADHDRMGFRVVRAMDEG